MGMLSFGDAIAWGPVLLFALFGCATAKERTTNQAISHCDSTKVEPGRVVAQKGVLGAGHPGAQIVGVVTFKDKPVKGVQVVATIMPKAGAGSVHQDTVELDVLSDAQGRFQLVLDAPTRFVVGLYHGAYRPNLTGEFALEPGQSLKLCAKMQLED